MPRRSRTYRAEYRSRVEKNRGLPREVAAGHGPVPIKTARALEKARREGKDIPSGMRKRTRQRQNIAAYEHKYWGELGTASPVRRRVHGVMGSRLFSSEEEAQDWAETLGISDYSFEIRETDNGWLVYRLH